MPQDFSGQNLRGRSFKGQNLEGANFSGADIRSADFTGANLTGANFSHVKAGLEPNRAVLHIISLCLLSGVSGFFSAFSGSLVSLLFENSSLESRIAGWTSLSVIIILFTVITRKGINASLAIAGAITGAFAIAGAIAGAVAGVKAGTIAVAKAKVVSLVGVGVIGETAAKIIAGAVAKIIAAFFILIVAIIGAIAGAFAVAFGVIGVFTVTIAFALAEAIVVAGVIVLAEAVAEVEEEIGTFAGTIAFAGVGTIAGAIAAAIAFTAVIAGTIAGAKAKVLAIAVTVARVETVIGSFGITKTGTILEDKAGAFAAIFSVLGIYIAYQALKGNEKYTIIRTTAIAFAAFGGTSFCNADLTDVDFTQASLKSTDFRKASLTRTYFHQVKKLDRVRPGTSYLQYANLRQVLTTGQGQDKNFDRLDLRGVNFQKAYLTDASFIATDLSYVSFQDADLSRAKLVQTQLDATDFTGTTLTGAYIEDWNITNETNFTGVRCQYIYMRLPTKENPDPLRKPDNNKEVFADGEFDDFIQPIFDTLDLYHNQGVDPRAIAISFKQLAENHPEADLRIVGMEVRGEDKFLLRAKTAATANKSQLSAEYFETYNEIKSLPEREIRLLLSEKDNQIRRLENMVMTALERPSFYSNTQVGQVSTMTSNPGGFSVGGSVGGDIRNLQGDNNRAIQGDNNQGVLGDNNQVTQQNQVGADTGESLTKEDVVKLLAQLETLIKGAELPADTKEEVIEDLSAAKKATDKEEPNKQRALERLGSVAETLDKTSKGIEGGQKIWTTAKPIIVKVATWLGVAAGSHLLGL